MTAPERGAETPPVVSVLRGDPTPDEVAALLVVLASRQPATGTNRGPRRSLWASRARTLRVPLFPGRGAWRASGLSG